MTVEGTPESNCLLRPDPRVIWAHALSEYGTLARPTGVLAIQWTLLGVQPDASSRMSLPDAPVAGQGTTTGPGR